MGNDIVIPEIALHLVAPEGMFVSQATDAIRFGAYITGCPFYRTVPLRCLIAS